MGFDVKKGLTRHKIAVNALRVGIGKLYMKGCCTTTEYYKPKHDTFIIVSNHCDVFDPGVEMICLKRYIRYVASDHLLHVPIFGKAMRFFGGVIVKHRDRSSDLLNEEIIENIKAGIPVGIHAEGATTLNGETGFISEHTGQLVKDSGAALITFRFTGGYIRAPRWARYNRKGAVVGKVVAEYSPEELSELSAEEITEIIRRDTYVNAFDEQKKEPKKYKGKRLAEYVERVLYVCPHCKKAGGLHSKDATLTCSCGYEVTYGTDGLFHEKNMPLVFDNILDWDKWQREIWKDKILSAPDGEMIFEDKNLSAYTRINGEKTLICNNASLRLYKDCFKIVKENGEEITINMTDITRLQTPSKNCLVIIDNEKYYDIYAKIPTSVTKYNAAWRYIVGKEYY